MTSENCKVVTVGDGAVGKTCLLMVYVNNEFPDEYVPTVFDNYDTNVKHKDKLIKMSLWDTAGQEEYDKLRYLSYPNTNVFLVCFSVMSKASLDNVKDKWMKELKQYSPGTPVILVGTKIDMLEDEKAIEAAKERNEEIVTREMAEQMAKEIKAVCYVPTSARTQEGVREAFEKAIEVRFSKSKSSGGGGSGDKGGCCVIA